MADDKLRAASEVLDTKSLYPPPLLALLTWAAAYYHHPSAKCCLLAYLRGSVEANPSASSARLAWH